MTSSIISFHRAGSGQHGAHHVQVTPHATGRRHVLHDVLDLLLLALVGVAVWFLWPAALGGSTRFIVVQGSSMAPVYHLGDAVVVKELAHPQVGDIIVFQIPKGEPAAGMLVVHRIHAVRSDGTFETKGDNREYPDPFRIHRTDILGSPAWTLPHFGRLIGVVSNPIVVGIVSGLLSMLVFLPKAWNDHAAALAATGDDGDNDDDGDIGDAQPADAIDAER